MRTIILSLLPAAPIAVFAEDTFQENVSPAPPAPRVGEAIDKRVPPRAVRINAEVVELDIVEKRLDAKVQTVDTANWKFERLAIPDPDRLKVHKDNRATTWSEARPGEKRIFLGYRRPDGVVQINEIRLGEENHQPDVDRGRGIAGQWDGGVLDRVLE